MRSFDDVDAFRGAVGEGLGHSPWLTVDQHCIDSFADATRGQRGASAHGYLSLSLVPPLLKQVYEVKNVAMSLNYGTNRIRFPATVRVDSRVRAHARLLAATSASVGHRFVVEVSVEREGCDEPACVAEVVLVLVGRDRSDTEG